MRPSARAVAIVQARMGSTRFPGKMLCELAGRPLLDHILERALRIRSADEVVLATTSHVRDDVLATIAAARGLTTVRGPEENVLERFLMAVEVTGATVVIRVCGDAPLFDPDFLDRCVVLLRSSDADLVRIRGDVPTAHQGAEVVSARALRWSREQAPDDPLATEHVTGYVFAHPEGLRVAEIDAPPALMGQFRLSIDRAIDHAVMKGIYDRLYVPGEIVSLRDAVALLRAANA